MAKLLLADDSVTIHRVIEMTFAGEDISVMAVSDGEQAIARIAEERPDIVLASIATPKRNGYDVSAFVKSRPDLASIPVLLMAGAFEPVDQQRAEQVKCDGVLVKPLEPQQVIARVRELIGGARGTPSQATSGVPRPVERLTAPLKLVEPRRQAPAAPAPRPEPAPPRTAVAPPPPAPKSPPMQPPARPAAMPPAARAPEPPSAFEGEDTVAEGLDDALDDYFDRLDAAFANLSSTSAEEAETPSKAVRKSKSARPAPARAPEPDDDNRPVPTIDSLLGLRETPRSAPDPVDVPLNPPPPHAPPPRPVRHEAFGAEPPAAPPPRPAPVVAPPVIAPVEALEVQPPADDVPPADVIPAAVVRPVEPMPVGAPPVTPPATLPPATLPPAPAPVSPTPASAEHDEALVAEARHSIADAFNALLAAELGERKPVPVQFRPAVSEPKITDELVDAVTRRVIERLAPDVVRKVVVDVVSELAERLIREEIARIREKK